MLRALVIPFIYLSMSFASDSSTQYFGSHLLDVSACASRVMLLSCTCLYLCKLLGFFLSIHEVVMFMCWILAETWPFTFIHSFQTNVSVLGYLLTKIVLDDLLSLGLSVAPFNNAVQVLALMVDDAVTREGGNVVSLSGGNVVQDETCSHHLAGSGGVLAHWSP